MMMIRAAKNTHGYQWTQRSPGTFNVCGQTRQALPAGAYQCETDYNGTPFFQKRDLQVDELIDFPGSLPAKIIAEIDRFWDLGYRYSQLGFLHRRGYLLYGKQGGGKSSLIHQVIGRVVASGEVAFFCKEPSAFITCMEKFREVEPDRPMLCVFEDIDAIIYHHGEDDLLQWLDGNNQIDRAVNLASTNYPERLDARIVSRPRRFDRILRIESPSAELRQRFMQRKLPEQTEAERAQWVELTGGMTFAAMAELVISVNCFGDSLTESVERLRRLDKNPPSSEEFAEEGFSDESLLPV